MWYSLNMEFEYFREVAIPTFKSQRALVEWMLQVARPSHKPSINANEFIYEFGIPRISSHIFQLRKEGWVIDNLSKHGKSAEYLLIRTNQEVDQEVDNRQSLLQ